MKASVVDVYARAAVYKDLKPVPLQRQVLIRVSVGGSRLRNYAEQAHRRVTERVICLIGANPIDATRSDVNAQRSAFLQCDGSQARRSWI